VIVIDVNLLLYSYSAPSTRQEKARAWLEKTLSAVEPVGLPWQVISAFLRIVTNPKLPGLRRSPQEATAAVEHWLSQPNVRILNPGDSHWGLFRQMILDGQALGDLVGDAHLAALTIEYGGVLYTVDRDFARFPGLRWVNPLEG
jgi:hypothetical protein